MKKTNATCLFNLSLGIWATIIGFANSHNTCCAGTSIGKINLPVVLLMLGLRLGIDAIMQSFKNNPADKNMTISDHITIFMIVWLIMSGVILFSSKSTCRTDSPLFYWTTFNVVIYSAAKICYSWYIHVSILVSGKSKTD